MPRKKLIRQNLFPYHIFIRTNNRDWFGLPMELVWQIATTSLVYAHKKVPVELHGFVLMNNHYHMLVTTPNENIDKFMEHFNRRLSNCIKKFSGHENHKFANRYKWSIINSQSYLMNIYRYIYQNPVRAGICNKCIDYPFSSLNFPASLQKNLEFIPHIKYKDYNKWIEQVPKNEINEVIKKGLRRTEFQIPQKTPRYSRTFLLLTPSTSERSKSSLENSYFL